MRSEIEKAFSARYPDFKPNQVSKAVDKYVDATLEVLGRSLAEYGWQPGEEIALPKTDLREPIGKITLNGKQVWALNLFEAYREASLYTEDYRGNVGKYTRVTLNPKYEKQIMQELINLNFELSDKRLKEMENAATHWIPCDPSSIDAYLAKTLATYTEELHNTDKHAYCRALERNMLIANQLKAQMVRGDNTGEYLLPEVYEEVDSGRMYGQGLSLQRVPKHVRHAALGLCWSYDFKASCYALLTGLALSINPNLKVGAIKEYVTDRASIRARIAKSLGVTEARMKSIFSSLGFGAKLVNNPHMSIRKELGPEKYQMLMNNSEFQFIDKAFKLVRATILAAYPGNTFNFMGLNYSHIDPTSDPLKPTKRSDDQKMAWIYQAMESKAIADFAAMAKASGYEPLLFAHDCVYFKQKLPTTLFHSCVTELRREFPLLQVEAEEIIPIHPEKKGPLQDAFGRYEDMIDTHRAFVDAEAMLADASFVSLEKRLTDELDPEFGHFANEIKALNPEANKSLGTSFNFGGLV